MEMPKVGTNSDRLFFMTFSLSFSWAALAASCSRREMSFFFLKSLFLPTPLQVPLYNVMMGCKTKMSLGKTVEWTM